MVAMTIEGVARITLTSPIGPITLTSVDQKIVSVQLSKAIRPLGHCPVLERARGQIAEYFSGNLKKFRLPVSVSGTKFQKAVWDEIAKVPFGAVISYGQIASKLENPKAARAVGMAVACNPIPLIIGCHRVLGAAGQLTGYSGGQGIKTKIALLDHEGISYRP
jgi:methylated-DNA-[protein]-cysteine S-methyltransferase